MEDVVAVVDAGVEGCEVETLVPGEGGGEEGGLGVPGGDVAGDEEGAVCGEGRGGWRGFMSASTTCQFLWRRCWVSARPIPEEAPVMRATEETLT